MTNTLTTSTNIKRLKAFGLLLFAIQSLDSIAAVPKTFVPQEIGGISVRELLELQTVVAEELTVVAAPARIEPESPASDGPEMDNAPLETPLVSRAAPGSQIRIRIEGDARVARVEIPAVTRVQNKRSSILRQDDAISAGGIGAVVKVRLEDGNLRVGPESVDVVGTSTRVAVDVAGTDLRIGKNVSFFVRDSDVMEWDPDAQQFETRSTGKTELYVVAAGKMQIVPVLVREGVAAPAKSPLLASNGPTEALGHLKVPDALTSVTGLIRPDKSNASLGDGTIAADETMAALTEGGLADAVAERSPDSNAGSVQGAINNEVGDAAQQMQYYRDVATVGYLNLSVQVVDDRSNLANSALYPVASLNVRIAGTEFLGKTDAQGRVTIKDVPKGSRFYVTVEDPYGRVRPTYSEVVTQRTPGEAHAKVVVMRQATFDAMAQIAGVTPMSGAASVCGRAFSKETKAPLAGIQIRTDVSGEGPYYFNKYGYLDASVFETGADGRFCIFNLEPGPLTLSFIEGSDVQATITIPTFAGRHVEEQIELGDEAPIVAGMATISTVEEQLGSDSIAANRYNPVEYADLIPIGDQESMRSVDHGVVKGRGVANSYRGRSLVVNQSGVFEPAVYSFTTADIKDAESPVVAPLLPRGFIEDMSNYAQVQQDVSLGSVFIEHGVQDAFGHEPLTFRLVNDRGEDVGTGWYYADYPVTKALFFNVPPGNYSLIVETGSHYWVGSTTVTVYSEHVSVVTSGKKLRQRANHYSAGNF